MCKELFILILFKENLMMKLLFYFYNVNFKNRKLNGVSL